MKEVLDKNGLSIVEEPTFGYKIFHKDDSDVLPHDSQKFRFPFCDVIVMTLSNG